eukprot:EG_transcript_16323
MAPPHYPPASVASTQPLDDDWDAQSLNSYYPSSETPFTISGSDSGSIIAPYTILRPGLNAMPAGPSLTPFTLTPYTVTPGAFGAAKASPPVTMPVPYGTPVQPQPFLPQGQALQWPPQPAGSHQLFPHQASTFSPQFPPQQQWPQFPPAPQAQSLGGTYPQLSGTYPQFPQAHQLSSTYPLPENVGMLTSYFPAPAISQPLYPGMQQPDAAQQWWQQPQQPKGAAVDYFSDAATPWPPATPAKADPPTKPPTPAKPPTGPQQRKAPAKASPAPAPKSVPQRTDSRGKPPPTALRHSQSVPPKKNRLGLTKEDKHELIASGAMVLGAVALAALLMI